MNVKHAKFYDSRYFISQYVAVLIIKYCKLNRTYSLNLVKKKTETLKIFHFCNKLFFDNIQHLEISRIV